MRSGPPGYTGALIFFFTFIHSNEKGLATPPPICKTLKNPHFFKTFLHIFFYQTKKTPKKQNKAKQRENENKTTPYLKIKCLS